MFFHSLKTKLIVGMTVLLVVAFGMASGLLIQEKTKELSEDIYRQIRSFSDLTALSLTELYERYLAEDSFVFFNREIQKFFAKTPLITGIGVASYDGVILYDSSDEQTRQYQGEPRQVPAGALLDRMQATYPSYALLSGRILYLKTDAEGKTIFVDVNEALVPALDPLERIENVIYPVGNQYVVLYSPSYDLLDQRIRAMWIKIILLALFSVLIGLFFAYFFSTRITRPIHQLQQGAAIIGAGDFSARVYVKVRDEVGDLAQTFNKMAEDLEKSIEARLYKERVGKELELASDIQKQILPKGMPQILGLDISADLIPAAEVGGDVYDFFSSDQENFFGYVGDVTGHGVPAGLVVSIANALFHSYAHLKDPKQILVEVNRIIKKKTTANMFITLVLWHWNATTQRLTLVSAGHEVALKYNRQAMRTEELAKGGMALGMVPDITTLLHPQEVPLQPGDCIVLYTDGIPEAWRNEKEQYGMPELKRVVTELCDLESADAIRTALLADVKEWAGDYEQKDDMTIMVIKRV